MKEIPLTRGQVSLVDDADYEELAKFRWYATWNQQTKSFYAARQEKFPSGKWGSVRMHRQIMDVLDAGRHVQVDHINHDTLNNTRENLRVVTPRQNNQNLKGKAEGKFSSKYPGVCWHKCKKKYQATIKVDGKKKHLGYADTDDAAYRLYQVACAEQAEQAE